MSRERFLKLARAITPFVLLAALFLGGLYFVLLKTMDRIIEDDAGLAASSYADYLASQPDEVLRLERGEGSAPSALHFLRSEAAARNIVEARVTGADGRTILSLNTPKIDGRPASKSPKAALVSKFEPVRLADGKDRWLQVVSDQSARRAHLDQDLFWALVALAFLTCCSFGVPAFVFLHEMAQRELSEERMTFMAHHDPMTGLLNRSAFNKTFDEQVSKRPGEVIAVHLIDVDRFKAVNDSLGHNMGDEVIKMVGAKMESLMGEGDFAARFGGDEFVMAQVGVGGAQDALTRAALVRRAIQEPLQAGEHQIRVTASIGIALAPRDGSTSSELAKNADIALYNAKADGRDTCRMYDPSMDKALEERRQIEKALLHAFATETFELHFQPIVVAAGEKLLGFEVLLRLKTEAGDPIGPTEFIPVAEEMGLISKIGAWVIRKACFAAAAWPDNLRVAVNLSPRQFENGELCDIVEQALADSGLSPDRLELEITEGLLVSDTERVMSQLRTLKAIGVSIAMDDFGTGYSSLSYLWQFPFDKLKIDRSFMDVLEKGDGQVSSILNTIISLGRTLNLEVTAEGVETAEQAAILQKLNCNQLQGYYFGRPTPEADIAGTILTKAKAQIDRAIAPVDRDQMAVG